VIANTYARACSGKMVGWSTCGAPISIQFDFVGDVPEIAEQALCNAVTGLRELQRSRVGWTFAVIYH
jgi:hypothetical protein